MIPLPNALMFAAFFLIGPFGLRNRVASLVEFGLIANFLIVALVSKRSSRRQSIALLCALAVLSYENIQSVAAWLHIELSEVPILGVREALNFVSVLFTLNVSLAVIGAAAAVVVGLSLEMRKSRLPLAKLFPEMGFSSASEELSRSVRRMSQMAGIVPPSLSLIDSGSPVAFITRSRDGYELALSVGLIESLSEDELEACIAHELSHVKNNDFAVRSLATAARVALFSHPLSHVIEPAVYRAREFLADKTAVKLVGGKDALISALAKIRESQDYVSSKPTPIATACLFGSPRRNRLLRLFDKHPCLDSRIEALRELDHV